MSKLHELSDEDFLARFDGSEEQSSEPVVQTDPVVTDDVSGDGNESDPVENGNDPVEEVGTQEESLPQEAGQEESPANPTDPVETNDEVSPGSEQEPIAPVQQEEAPQQSQVSAEEFTQKVMAPFVANGKTFSVKSPEEAISLMQQGANYTKKMQELAAHRRIIAMLENNGLLSEDKISNFIDLNNKDINAITKLVKDASINPLDIDVDSNVDYVPGNHLVTDKELDFTQTVDRVIEQPGGNELIVQIRDTWDQTSRLAIADAPHLLDIFYAQKKSGIFDTIVHELERRKLFGTISPTIPFIEAYTAVGEELKANGTIAANASTPVGNAPRNVVGTGPATPSKPADTSDKARALSQPRSKPSSKSTVLDFSKMSDEEFMKKFGG